MTCACKSPTYKLTPDRCATAFPEATWDTPERFSGETDIRDFASWTLATYDTWLRFEFGFTDNVDAASSTNQLIAEIQVSRYSTGDSPTTVARDAPRSVANESGDTVIAVASALIRAGLYYRVLGTLPCTEAELIAENDTLYAESYITRVEKKKET